MSKPTFKIDDANMEAVKTYIRLQFSNLSWWPGEEPLQAKEEFDCLQNNSNALIGWCEKWLDSGQWRQLKIAMKS